MPITKNNYKPQIVAGARSWLEKQPEDFIKCINSTDKIMKSYLKTQGEDMEPEKQSPFIKELKKYCNQDVQDKDFSKEDVAAYSLESKSPKNEIESPLAKDALVQDDFSKKNAGLLNIDARSLEVIEQARQHLNLSSSEEALKALIQIGFKSLKPLVS